MRRLLPSLASLILLALPPAAHAYTFTAYDAPGGPAGIVESGGSLFYTLLTDKTLGQSTLRGVQSPAVPITGAASPSTLVTGPGDGSLWFLNGDGKLGRKGAGQAPTALPAVFAGSPTDLASAANSNTSCPAAPRRFLLRAAARRRRRRAGVVVARSQARAKRRVGVTGMTPTRLHAAAAGVRRPRPGRRSRARCGRRAARRSPAHRTLRAVRVAAAERVAERVAADGDGARPRGSCRGAKTSSKYGARAPPRPSSAGRAGGVSAASTISTSRRRRRGRQGGGVAALDGARAARRRRTWCGWWWWSWAAAVAGDRHASVKTPSMAREPR